MFAYQGMANCMSISLKVACAALLVCVSLVFVPGPAAHAAAEPPNEAARKLLETRGPQKIVGDPQVVNCSIPKGTCYYTGPVGGWATVYFRGECGGYKTGKETMSCTPGKNVSCTKASPDYGWWQCSCNNWSTKKSDAHVTVNCPKP